MCIELFDLEAEVAVLPGQARSHMENACSTRATRVREPEGETHFVICLLAKRNFFLTAWICAAGEIALLVPGGLKNKNKL